MKVSHFSFDCSRLIGRNDERTFAREQKFIILIVLF